MDVCMSLRRDQFHYEIYLDAVVPRNIYKIIIRLKEFTTIFSNIFEISLFFTMRLIFFLKRRYFKDIEKFHALLGN